MGTLFSSDNPAAIGALAKAIAREVVRELAEAKHLPAIVEPQPAGAVFRVGPIVVDVERHEATVHGRLMTLKPREFALVAALAHNAGKVLSRTKLIELAWPQDGICVDSDRTVDVHVRRLRAHLGAERGWLETIFGLGYKLRDR
jgi:DNA-binding response OmpR family regulator